MMFERRGAGSMAESGVGDQSPFLCYPSSIKRSTAGREFASGEVLASECVSCKCVYVCVCVCLLAFTRARTPLWKRGEFGDSGFRVFHCPICFCVFFLAEHLSSPITTARTVAGASSG